MHSEANAEVYVCLFLYFLRAVKTTKTAMDSTTDTALLQIEVTNIQDRQAAAQFVSLLKKLLQSTINVQHAQ